MKKSISVYICPTEDCLNYFGSSTTGDLAKEFSGPKVEDRQSRAKVSGTEARISRVDCPDCAARGLGRVARVRTVISVENPKPVEVPPLPPVSGTLHN